MNWKSLKDHKTVISHENVQDQLKDVELFMEKFIHYYLILSLHHLYFFSSRWYMLHRHIEGVFRICHRHDNDTCNYIELCHFLKILSVSACQYQCWVRSLCLCPCFIGYMYVSRLVILLELLYLNFVCWSSYICVWFSESKTNQWLLINGECYNMN
jgi:hypothetical protein